MKKFWKVIAVLSLLLCVTMAEAAVQRVNFTLSAVTGESATGFITYDDTVVADGEAIGGNGLCGDPTLDNSIDYEIAITGGAIGNVTFSKADCSFPPAFCNVPDFTVDVNFFGCSASGVTGNGGGPNTFTVIDGSNTADLVFQTISPPTPRHTDGDAGSVIVFVGPRDAGRSLAGFWHS